LQEKSGSKDHIKQLERKTFALHLISQIFNGTALGVVLLQDIILKKTLGGSDLDVMLLSLLVSSAFLVSIYGSEIINRSESRSRTIIKIGFTAKAFFILLPLYNNPAFYIFCIAVSAYLDSMLLSSWNIVFKHNYTEENRSKFYSYATTIQTIMLLAVSTLFGSLLDLNHNIYKIFFPLAGLFGMFSYYNLSQMIALSMDDYGGRDKHNKTVYNWKLIKDILVLPARNMLRIFKENKPFLRFEIYFFLYGMAFMVITPAVPVFLVDTLKLSYEPISIAKGLVFHSTLILFTPIMGRFHGTGNPERFSGIMFLILSLYPLLMVFSKYAAAVSPVFNSVYVLYTAHFVFGLAMSGVLIAWALSSIYFAPPREVSNYQAAHITLTGIRGLFSPALGYAVMKIFAIEYTFYLSAALFLLGGILMLKEGRKQLIKNQ
jgi:hypothetical protein